MAGRRHLWIISMLALAVAGCSSDDAASSPGSAATTDAPSTSSAPSTTVPASTTAPTTAPTTAVATSSPSTTTAPATTAPLTTVAPTSAPPSTVASFEPPEVEVVVTDAGAEPATTRRLALSPGTTRVTMAQTQEIVQSIDGFEAPSSGPITIVMTLDVEVEQEADGYRLTSVIVDAAPGDDVDPEVADQLTAQFATLVGLEQTAVIDDLGRPLSATELSLPDGVPEDIAALLAGFRFEQIVTPLPEEAVGLGATWTIEQEIDQLGVVLLQRWVFELVEIDGDQLHVVGEGTQSVDPGPVELPGVPSVVSVTITSWEGQMSTDIWHDLNKPIADTTTTLGARQEFTFEDRTSSGELIQEITTAMVVSTE